MKKSILFISKNNDFYCKRAEEFIRLHFDYEICLGKRGDIFDEDLYWWKGDYIISYLSPWILPKELLERAKKACINFHPGPPEYPGIGCTNFAIYNNEHKYGITCHHMEEKVDSGKIIAVKRFQLYKTDSVYSLTQRCYAHILTLFYEIMEKISQNKPLPASDETWQRKPYTRKELNELCELTPDMSKDEIQRRIKATTYPNMPGVSMEIKGIKFIQLKD